MEQAGAVIAPVACHIADGAYGRNEQYGAQYYVYVFPHAFNAEVPYIDVVGYYLTEYYGEIVAYPTVYEPHVGAGDTQYPEYGRRHHLFRPFRQNPLQDHASGEKYLGYNAYSEDNGTEHITACFLRFGILYNVCASSDRRNNP